MSPAFQFSPETVSCVDAARLRRMAKHNPARARELLPDCQRRLEARRWSPAPEVAQELPIAAKASEIVELLRSHRVVIVAGETGSGKTTQLPKLCLQAGRGVRGAIAHTQPRRLAARTVAARIAEESGTPLGDRVGYAVRFANRTSERTQVKLMTDGLLLAEIASDRQLLRYDTVIVDEAHERSLNVDFLLGYLKQLSRRRQDLTIVVTSATIDVEAFAAYFDNAPVVEVSGRGYPVELRYVDTDDAEGALVASIEDIAKAPLTAARDVLVFQYGEREIFSTARTLRQHFGDSLEVLPLYARLPRAQQQQVFTPGRRRRVILATNVAETSLTVPNIGYVIDPGFARISRYAYGSKLQRLPVEAISQASAQQRAGRAGRIAPGECVRLYSQTDFAGRPEFTDPEIRRTNLAAVILQMRMLGFGRVADFPFLDPPQPQAVRAGQRLLEELGALDGDKITKLGRRIASFPVDPRLARMLVAAEPLGCVAELLVLVSAQAIQDPRERPPDKRGSADAAHERFSDERSDFLGLLKLWAWLRETRSQLSRRQFDKRLRQMFLSPARVVEWWDMHRQLRAVAEQQGMSINAAPAGYAAVHRALTTGSLSFVGMHDEKGTYLGPRGLKFRIFPGSAVSGRSPKWIIAGEIAETARVYARAVASVEAKWIEDAAAHLVKRRVADPHWSLRKGEVMAYEWVTLYGLPLVERRPIRYEGIDRAACRQMFIADGLVAGALKQPPAFLDANLKRQREVLDEEAKTRARGIAADPDELAAWYDARLPEDVCSVRRLVRWLKKDPQRDALLRFGEEDVRASGAARASERAFPGTLEYQGITLTLRYRFAPGEADDGVCVRVPVGMLAGISEERLQWNVPGNLPLVVEAWLRALPKRLRRQVSPISDRVDEVCTQIGRRNLFGNAKLENALAEILRDLYGINVVHGDWNRERLDPQVSMFVEVEDEQGRVIASGRDLGALKSQFREYVSDVVSRASQRLDTQAWTSFPETDIPDSEVVEERGVPTVVYPAIVDRETHVELDYFASRREQRAANRRGLVRLVLLEQGDLRRSMRRALSDDRRLGLLFAPLGNADVLFDELVSAVVWNELFEDQGVVRDRDSFAAIVRSRRARIYPQFESMRQILAEVLEKRLQLVQLLESLDSPAFVATVKDAREQLDSLVSSRMLTDTRLDHFAHFPRYLDALAYRLGNLQGKVARDRDLADSVGALRTRIEALSAHDADRDEVQALRFALEELRVAVFAEPLRKERISVKRLDKRIEVAERASGLR